MARKKIVRLTQGVENMLEELMSNAPLQVPRSQAVATAIYYADRYERGSLSFQAGTVADSEGNERGSQVCISLSDDTHERLGRLATRWECSDNKAILTAIILLFYEDYDRIFKVTEEYNSQLTPSNKGGRPRQEDTVRISFTVAPSEARELRRLAQSADRSIGLFVRAIARDYLRGSKDGKK